MSLTFPWSCLLIRKPSQELLFTGFIYSPVCDQEFYGWVCLAGLFLVGFFGMFCFLVLVLFVFCGPTT